MLIYFSVESQELGNDKFGQERGDYVLHY